MLRQLLDQNILDEDQQQEDFTSLDRWFHDVTGILTTITDFGNNPTTSEHVVRSARNQGNWDQYTWKTCKAAMDGARCGVFRSQTRQSLRRDIDLNRDIDTQFHRKVIIPIRDAIRLNFNQTLDQIVFTSTHRRTLLQLERERLRYDLQRIKQRYFESSCVEITRYKLSSDIYRALRSNMTTPRETDRVLQELDPCRTAPVRRDQSFARPPLNSGSCATAKTPEPTESLASIGLATDFHALPRVV